MSAQPNCLVSASHSWAFSSQLESVSSTAVCWLRYRLSAQLQLVCSAISSAATCCNMRPQLSSVSTFVFCPPICVLSGWLWIVSLAVMCQLSCHALAQVQSVSARQLLLSAQLPLVSFPLWLPSLHQMTTTAWTTSAMSIPSTIYDIAKMSKRNYWKRCNSEIDNLSNVQYNNVSISFHWFTTKKCGDPENHTIHANSAMTWHGMYFFLAWAKQIMECLFPINYSSCLAARMLHWHTAVSSKLGILPCLHDVGHSSSMCTTHSSPYL